MNRSEKFVSYLCTKSFLSLWSYSNPRKRASHKELCDVLVVCEPDIVIFSVKEVGFKESGNRMVDVERWRNKAIAGSAKQIYGAERELSEMTHVISKEGKVGIGLPPLSTRRVHRIAVALGSKGEVPITFGDFGKGFVHVFNEISLLNIMAELDTITDFVGYLRDKETLCLKGTEINFRAEEDLLAVYLHNGRTFPDAGSQVVIGPGLWEVFIEKPQFLAKKREDETSYAWDRLIETFCTDFLVLERAE